MTSLKNDLQHLEYISFVGFFYINEVEKNVSVAFSFFICLSSWEMVEKWQIIEPITDLVTTCGSVRASSSITLLKYTVAYHVLSYNCLLSL